MGFTHNIAQGWISFEYLSGDTIGGLARPLLLSDVHDYAIAQSLSGVEYDSDVNVVTFTGWGLIIKGLNTYFECKNLTWKGYSLVYNSLLYLYNNAKATIDRCNIEIYSNGKRFVLGSMDVSVSRTRYFGFSYLQSIGCKIEKSYIDNCTFIALSGGAEISDVVVTGESVLWFLGDALLNNVIKTEGSNGVRLDAYNFQATDTVEIRNIKVSNYYQAALYYAIVNKFNSYALIDCNVSPSDYFVGTINVDTGWLKVYFRTTISIFIGISNYDLKIYDRDNNLIVEKIGISSFSQEIDFDYIKEEFIDAVRQPTVRNTFQPFRILISKTNYNDLEFNNVTVSLGHPTILKGSMVLETPEITGVSITNPGTTNDDGQIAITAEKGTQPYTYSINGTDYQESDTFTGLSEGTYSVYVKDANDSVDSIEGIVLKATVPVIPRLTVLEVTHPTAQDGNGSITVAVEGGEAPYEYSIDGGEYQASPVFTGLSAGDYDINVRDNFGSVGTLEGVSLKATKYYDRALNCAIITKNVVNCDIEPVVIECDIIKT